MYKIFNNFQGYTEEVQVAIITSCVAFAVAILTAIYNRNFINSLIALKINKYLENLKLENSKKLEEHKINLLKEMEESKSEYNINTEIVNNRFDYLTKVNNKLYVIRKIVEEILEDNSISLQNELRSCIKDFKNFYGDNNSIAKLTLDADSHIHPLKEDLLLPIYSKLLCNEDSLISFEVTELNDIVNTIKTTSNFIIQKIKKFDKE